MSLLKEIKEEIKADLYNWFSNPLYHGGIVEDIIISLLCVVGLGVVIWIAH